MWMLPLYLHVNPDYDDDMIVIGIFVPVTDGDLSLPGFDLVDVMSGL